MGDDEFLVGYQGYGEFKTLHYGRDGAVLGSWPTHGYYVVCGSDVRVVELRNDGAMHLTRLATDGQVIEGAWLDGYYTSRPCVRTDGSIVFCRGGKIFSARDLHIAERFLIFDRSDALMQTVMDPDCAHVTVTLHRLGASGVAGHSRMLRIKLSADAKTVSQIG
jgi:hypothetical protein